MKMKEIGPGVRVLAPFSLDPSMNWSPQGCQISVMTGNISKNIDTVADLSSRLSFYFHLWLVESHLSGTYRHVGILCYITNAELVKHSSNNIHFTRDAM